MCSNNVWIATEPLKGHGGKKKIGNFLRAHVIPFTCARNNFTCSRNNFTCARKNYYVLT